MSSGSSNIDPLELDALPDEFNIEDDRSTGRQRRRRGRGRPRIGPQFVRPQINVVRRNAQQIYGHRRMGARQRTSAQQTESTLRPPQAVVQGRQVSVLLRLVTQHPGQQETGTILRLTIDLPDQSGNTSPEHMQNMSPETNTTETDQPQTQAQHRLQLLQQALPRGRPVRMQVPWSMTVPISLPQRPTLPESQYQMETQLQMGSQSQVESQLAEPQAQPAQMLSTQLPAQSQSEPQSQLEEQTPPAPEYRPEAQSQPLESLSQPEQQPVIRVEPQPQEESPVLSGPQPQAFIQPTPPQLSPDVQILFLPMMGVEPHVQSHLLGELRFRPGQASQPHHHRRSHRRHRRQMEHETGLRDQPHFYIDSSEQPQSEAPQQHFDPNNPHSPPSI